MLCILCYVTHKGDLWTYGPSGVWVEVHRVKEANEHDIER